jgi:ketosteroid isomerase-like protein
MSQEQVEVVRAHLEAFRSLGDASRTLSFLDPHVVLDVSRTGGDEEAIYGREAIAEFMRRWIGTFEEYRYEVERLTDLGSGAVLAAGVSETGRGKGSGVPVGRAFAALYTVIDGKIARMTVFRTEQDALEAAGLRE